jgi:signal transduction histidine kinase
MEKKQSRSQAIAILITATALLLFVASAFQYKEYSFFYFLLISRIVMVVGGYGIAIGLMVGKIKLVKTETYYFLFCLMMQALHGILEGSLSTAFYSFTGPWLILCSLSLQENFESWIKKTFPFQILGFLIPLIFKDPQYFASIGTFVDVFSLPVSGLVVGLVLAKITSDRYEVISEKFYLEKKLNKALSENLSNEKEIRTRVEVELKKAKLDIEQTAELRATSELAAMVSHDIRSPLAALNMLLSQIDSIPESQRVLTRASVNRINDIGNALLEKGRNPDTKGRDQEVDISSLIRSIVSEKQIQYQDKKDLIIEEDLRESDGKLVRMQSSEFSRVLSNLINNSIEAFYQEKGKVRIRSNYMNNCIQISISDNGRGIPESIIEKLGQRGFSFGKEASTNSGSGLGVYHAKKYIESIGGKFEIQSQVSIGTNIIISLPRYNE